MIIMIKFHAFSGWPVSFKKSLFTRAFLDSCIVLKPHLGGQIDIMRFPTSEKLTTAEFCPPWMYVAGTLLTYADFKGSSIFEYHLFLEEKINRKKHQSACTQAKRRHVHIWPFLYFEGGGASSIELQFFCWAMDRCSHRWDGRRAAVVSGSG